MKSTDGRGGGLGEPVRVIACTDGPGQAGSSEGMEREPRIRNRLWEHPVNHTIRHPAEAGSILHLISLKENHWIRAPMRSSSGAGSAPMTSESGFPLREAANTSGRTVQAVDDRVRLPVAA